MKLTNNKNFPEVIVKAAMNDTYVSMGDISVTGLIDSPRIRQYKILYGDQVEYDVEELLPSLEGTAFHNIFERADIDDTEPRAIEDVIFVYRKKQRAFEEKAAKTEDSEKKEKFLFYANKFREEADWNYDFLRKSYKNYKTIVINEPIIILNFEGLMIKGQIDRLILNPDGTANIEDYKMQSCWAFADQHEKKIWTEQQNLYALMVEKAGVEKWPQEMRRAGTPGELIKPKVVGLRIIRWYRDWQKMKSIASSPNIYPPKKVMTFDLTRWEYEQTRQFIKERVALHTQAAKDIESVDCTPRDKWLSDVDEFKVYNSDSPGRAKKVFTTEEQAIAEAKSMEHKHPVEVRKYLAKPRRCVDYCKFQKWCTQYKREYGPDGYKDGSYVVVYKAEQSK
jgi:hypothetical protein